MATPSWTEQLQTSLASLDAIITEPNGCNLSAEQTTRIKAQIVKLKGVIAWREEQDSRMHHISAENDKMKSELQNFYEWARNTKQCQRQDADQKRASIDSLFKNLDERLNTRNEQLLKQIGSQLEKHLDQQKLTQLAIPSRIDEDSLLQKLENSAKRRELELLKQINEQLKTQLADQKGTDTDDNSLVRRLEDRVIARERELLKQVNKHIERQFGDEQRTTINDLLQQLDNRAKAHETMQAEDAGTLRGTDYDRSLRIGTSQQRQPSSSEDERRNRPSNTNALALSSTRLPRTGSSFEQSSSNSARAIPSGDRIRNRSESVDGSTPIRKRRKTYSSSSANNRNGRPVNHRARLGTDMSFSSDSGDIIHLRNNNAEQAMDHNTMLGRGIAVTIDEILDELDAYDENGTSKRSPPADLSQAVKTALQQELSVYQSDLPALRTNVRAQPKSVVARKHTSNKVTTPGLDDPASCNYCLMHGRLCIVKARNARPVIVPLPLERRGGKTRDKPEYWLSR